MQEEVEGQVELAHRHPKYEKGNNGESPPRLPSLPSDSDDTKDTRQRRREKGGRGRGRGRERGRKYQIRHACQVLSIGQGDGGRSRQSSITLSGGLPISSGSSSSRLEPLSLSLSLTHHLGQLLCFFFGQPPGNHLRRKPTSQGPSCYLVSGVDSNVPLGSPTFDHV